MAGTPISAWAQDVVALDPVSVSGTRDPFGGGLRNSTDYAPPSVMSGGARLLSNEILAENLLKGLH